MKPVRLRKHIWRLTYATQFERHGVRSLRVALAIRLNLISGKLGIAILADAIRFSRWSILIGNQCNVQSQIVIAILAESPEPRPSQGGWKYSEAQISEYTVGFKKMFEIFVKISASAKPGVADSFFHSGSETNCPQFLSCAAWSSKVNI